MPKAREFRDPRPLADVRMERTDAARAVSGPGDPAGPAAHRGGDAQIPGHDLKSPPSWAAPQAVKSSPRPLGPSGDLAADPARCGL
jgi:hypothetical protein